MEIKQRDALVQQIQDAFFDTPTPQIFRGDLKILQHHHWRTVPDEKIRYAVQYIDDFTPDQFRYFLPAFMLYTTHHPDYDSLVQDAIVGMLAPPDETQSTNTYLASRFYDRVKELNQAEKIAVRDFLLAYDGLNPYSILLTAREQADLDNAILFWMEIVERENK